MPKFRGPTTKLFKRVKTFLSLLDQPPKIPQNVKIAIFMHSIGVIIYLSGLIFKNQHDVKNLLNEPLIIVNYS